MAATDAVRTGAPPARERAYEELERIFAGVDAPFALVDLDAMWANARELLGRAAGTPIRVASKSCAAASLLAAMLEHARLPRAHDVHAAGVALAARPRLRRPPARLPHRRPRALAELARIEAERPPILMVDSVDHLDYIEAAAGASGRPIRVCLELDTGWWPLGGRLKVGAKRSPVARRSRRRRSPARSSAGPASSWPR